jgi:hypothetical protein
VTPRPTRLEGSVLLVAAGRVAFLLLLIVVGGAIGLGMIYLFF